MPRFFLDYVPDDHAVVSGADGRHIARSLRMQPGEELILCDCIGMDYRGEIERIDGDAVHVRILECCKSASEPTVQVTLYQGLPKADKFDTVVQKAVELGVTRIVPMMTSRCVSRPDEKSARKKQERWQKIAEEAAKQSGRGIIPKVSAVTPYRQAVSEAVEDDAELILFYEGGGKSLSSLVGRGTQKLSVMIGPEGGFSREEVDLAEKAGGHPGTLGPRILRTETAPVAALAAIMLATGNLE